MRQRPWWWFPPPSSSYSPAPLPRSYPPYTHKPNLLQLVSSLLCPAASARGKPRKVSTTVVRDRWPAAASLQCCWMHYWKGRKWCFNWQTAFFFLSLSHGLRPHLAELKRRAAAGDTVRVDGSVPAVRGRKMMGGGCRVNVRCWGNNKWVIVTGLGTQQRALRSIRLTRAYYWKALPLIVDEEWYRL